MNNYQDYLWMSFGFSFMVLGGLFLNSILTFFKVKNNIKRQIKQMNISYE